MQTQIVDAQKIREADMEEMFNLFDTFYANTDRERFQHDLKEKDWLIRMLDNGKLVGFSTQKEVTLRNPVEPQRYLFSGDTIVHPDYWNRSQLAGAFGHLFSRLLEQDHTPLYWFLISKGFRTYRFLPVFFREFIPHHQQKHPELKTRLDAVATSMFGALYDATSGRVDFQGQRDHLRDVLVDIPPGREQDPHVAFFLQANPGYACGTELACICPLSEDNLTGCGKRVIRNTEVAWHV